MGEKVTTSIYIEKEYIDLAKSLNVKLSEACKVGLKILSQINPDKITSLVFKLNKLSDEIERVLMKMSSVSNLTNTVDTISKDIVRLDGITTKLQEHFKKYLDLYTDCLKKINETAEKLQEVLIQSDKEFLEDILNDLKEIETKVQTIQDKNLRVSILWLIARIRKKIGQKLGEIQ